MKMKRMLCVILSFVLLFSLLFVTVYADEEGNGEISETTAAVQEETTTEAVVQAPPLPEIFTVKLDYGGHGENKELAVPAYEKIVNKPEAPFLEGSVFDGWYIDKKTKQAGIHIFQKYHLDSRQVCGEEVFLGQRPGLEPGR